ncbi:MAG TPA: esterase [Verrucomicrobiae bacterium]
MRQFFHREIFTIEGVAREAVIFIPAGASKAPAPVVFVFHGHGGSSQRALEQFTMPKNWPEAISVHMQGLATASAGDPEGKKPGWQNKPGDYGDRDLKFFDAVLNRLVKSGKADEKHIYVTGFSNGGGFTYVLWAARGDKLAAVAPAAAPNANRMIPQLKPKPVLSISGLKDALVKYDNQMEAVEGLRKLNGCEGPGRQWGRQGKLYRSKTGTPVLALVHPGGHEVPDNVPLAVVKFFQADMRLEEPTE